MKILQKQIKLTLIVFFVFFTVNITCAQQSAKDEALKENIEIVITKDTSQEEIDKMVKELQENGVELILRKLKFDKNKKLIKIAGKIDFNDGFSGAFKTNELGKIIINRIYDEVSEIPFSIKVQ